MHDSCTKQIFITDTHHPGSFVRSLSFDLKRPTNRGTRGVHVQRSCPSDFLPHIRKCPRLPAGNWVFQGRRLNSSSWLYWGRERRWFSSSWFLGRGCKRWTKRSRGGNCLSQRSKSDEAQRKRSRRESCEWLFSTNQSPDLLKTSDSRFIVFSFFSVDWWIWEWAMLRLYALNLSWEASCMDEPRAYFTGTHTHTCRHTIRPYFPRAKHSSFTSDSFAAGTDSGKWTSILGSYSPMTPTRGRQ